MSISNENIRVNTTIPSLKDKIKLDVDVPTDKVYWYIRFNTPLDKTSVSKDTMNVTDTEGYIMRTYISYDETENLIVIVPKDSYQQNRYYLLNISKEVRSEKGQGPKHEMHILFKLINNRISEFEVLKKNVKVPYPRPRPSDYDEKNTVFKVYTPESRELIKSTSLDVLPFGEMKINIILGVLGLLLIIISVFVNIPVFTFVSIGICLFGVLHIFYQLSKKSLRSTITYNRGVMHFNSENYKKANILFKKALSIDEKNELAEFALSKSSFYI